MSRPLSLFDCVKAVAPIPVGSPLVHEALVLAALDPFVLSVEPVRVDLSGHRAEVIALGRLDGCFVLDVVEPAADIEAAGLGLAAAAALDLPRLTLTAAEIRRLPRRHNAAAVWACRSYAPAVDARLRILAALDDDGALPLAEAAAAVQGFDAAPVRAVLALACADLLAVDLASGPLGPQTRVRRILREGGRQ